MTEEERLLTVRKLVRPVPCCLLEGYVRTRARVRKSSKRRQKPKKKRRKVERNTQTKPIYRGTRKQAVYFRLPSTLHAL